MKFHGAFFKRPTSKIKQAKIYFILNSSSKISKGGPPKSAECASIELSNQRFCYWNIEFYVSDWTKPKLSNISNKYASMFSKLSYTTGISIFQMFRFTALCLTFLSISLVVMTTRGDCDSEMQCVKQSRDRLLLCYSSCNTLPRGKLTCLKSCYLNVYRKTQNCILDTKPMW